MKTEFDRTEHFLVIKDSIKHRRNILPHNESHVLKAAVAT